MYVSHDPGHSLFTVHCFTVRRRSMMSILSRPRAFNSFILVLFRAESFKCFGTDEDSPWAISTPSSLNLLPRTIFVIAGSGFTPRGFGGEWSAYQRDTWDKVMPRWSFLCLRSNRDQMNDETWDFSHLGCDEPEELPESTSLQRQALMRGPRIRKLAEKYFRILTNLSVNQYNRPGSGSMPGPGIRPRRCSTSPSLEDGGHQLRVSLRGTRAPSDGIHVYPAVPGFGGVWQVWGNVDPTWRRWWWW